MFKIEVYTKINFRNSYAEHILFDINTTGLALIDKLYSSYLYAIDGNLTIRQINIIATELLIDKITEGYYCKNNNLTENEFSFNKTDHSIFCIEIWYKNGVTDTVAETVTKAVKDLGIMNKISVKRGYKYYLYSHRQILQETVKIIVSTCLCNVLIQDYIIKQHK
ncbi:MAG: phosphoribosylformylglycinamidine synthase subunit PurS [Endomicrobium sp.]|jgi:phosphoribosylformylglycinamidine synthase|nr:phosphoribosylformylglycinamidine synthase subunit PurS [Endomicrobium sp.]